MTFNKLIAQNKKAFHDYEILETYEAGLVLKGSEVKSVRDGKVSIKEGYLAFARGELWLEKMHLTPYQTASSFEPLRKRKVLLKKSELKRLAGRVSERGFTLVPLKLYWKDNWAKVEIGLARGKKLYDKREAIKKKTVEREIKRFLSESQKK